MEVQQLESPRKGVKITHSVLFYELLVCSNAEAQLVTAATASLKGYGARNQNYALYLPGTWPDSPEW